MASNVAAVVDGVLQQNKTPSSRNFEPAKGSKLDYQDFLQLLCAEMQYQDPLEPTSNTEYVAQLATFSQVEAMLAMQNTQQSAMANDLVGKTVILQVEDETTGRTNTVDGVVDYVLYKNGETYLSVNGNEYPLSSLETVVNNEYYEAAVIAATLANMVKYLPDLDNVRPEHEIMITQVKDIYDGLSDYQRQFVDDDTVKQIGEYWTRLQEVLEQQKESEGNGEDGGDSDSGDENENIA